MFSCFHMHGRDPGTLLIPQSCKNDDVTHIHCIYKHASGRDWVKCWASPVQAPTTCQHFESTPCFTDQTPIPWTWQVAESIDVKMVIMASVACSFEARVLSASEVLPTTCHKRGNKGVTLEIHGNTQIWEYSESILKLHKHTLNMVESSMLPATFASVRLFTTVQHTQKLISPAKIFQQGYQKYSTCRTWSLPGAFTKNNTQSLDPCLNTFLQVTRFKVSMLQGVRNPLNHGFIKRVKLLTHVNHLAAGNLETSTYVQVS